MKTCDRCILENSEDNEICDDCSRADGSGECTCHVIPPCSFCVDDKYEEKSEVKPILNLNKLRKDAKTNKT